MNYKIDHAVSKINPQLSEYGFVKMNISRKLKNSEH